MATQLRIRRRSAGGAAGAPAALLSAELAYNMSDRIIYIGYGDDGSGNATSVRAFAADDFWQNVPNHGGTAGKALISTINGMQWGDLPEGALYTASGNGIELDGTEFNLNFTEIATGVGLSNYVTSSSLSTTLGGYVTDSDLTTTLGGYVTDGELSTALGGYVTDGELTTALGGYTTTATLTGLLDDKSDVGHTHDAADISSGVLDVARIPVLPGNRTITSTGGIAALTSGQQNDIAEGTIVTTTDGRRWVYSGTGSKTAEASYIVLADTTPVWAVIEDKPAFHVVATSGSYTDLTNRPTYAAVATSGSYSDLTDTPALATVATSGSYNDLANRPTLGTMAAQNANAVAITGGTIDGVVIDGGTF